MENLLAAFDPGFDVAPASSKTAGSVSLIYCVDGDRGSASSIDVGGRGGTDLESAAACLQCYGMIVW